MRAVQLLLVAIALISLSSVTVARSAETMARVSALTPGFSSVILNPDKACSAAECSADCSRMYKGTGKCFGPVGCDCEYCPSASATTATGSKN
uniref:Knottin scorpion toxin-like domain-containing protein n=1 Tax=Oryza punctata TaxID=4537 RepID=A0A0E0K5U8_ORYPU